MAGSDDTAEGQHVQRGSLLPLVCSAQLDVSDRGREDVHHVILLCSDDQGVLLHPEYSAKVFIDCARTLTLRTAGEEPASLRLHVPAKHDLILMTSAEGTGFAVELPTDGPDLPDLFVHQSLLQEINP